MYMFCLRQPLGASFSLRLEQQMDLKMAFYTTNNSFQASTEEILASVYKTTDVDEFKTLYHDYLIGRQQQLEESDLYYLSTKARGEDTNGKPITTFAFGDGHLHWGFRNQMIGLTMLVIRANLAGHEQLLLDSLNHLDCLGSEKYDPFEFYFDVEHWNRYSYQKEDTPSLPGLKNPEKFPNRLPRLVFYDPSLHDQWDPVKKSNKDGEIVQNATRPFMTNETFRDLMYPYYFYVKGWGDLVAQFKHQAQQKILRRNPAEILMLQGALRPHPALQAVIDRSKEHLRKQVLRHDGSADESSFRYMTLHARIEPDMQKHRRCGKKKVREFQDIVDMIESKWPEPPVDVIFLPINRQVLEKEVALQEEKKNSPQKFKDLNLIAMRNLKVLNRLTRGDEDGKYVGGMWNGRVPVVEFGFEALRGTVYEHRPSTSGAILDFFLGLDADIFVGTEVSSFSVDILSARFYRDDENGKNRKKYNNYKYLNGGLEEWITQDMTAPPGFSC